MTKKGKKEKSETEETKPLSSNSTAKDESSNRSTVMTEHQNKKVEG